MTNVWLSGPSGSGKSYISDMFRSRELCRTFDLDFVGYRLNSGDWKEWNIPPGIFSVLRVPNLPILAVGCDSHFPNLLRAAVSAGFVPLILLPSSDIVAGRRAKRGDKAEKIAAALNDVNSWAAKAAKYDVRIVESADEVAKYFRSFDDLLALNQSSDKSKSLG